MISEFRQYLDRALDPNALPFREWEDLDKRKYSQSLKHLKANVVGRASVIACTTSESAVMTLRQNAGMSTNWKLAIMIDEAYRDREADSYIPLAKFKHQIVAVHLLGDTKQATPVCVSSEKMNEFTQRGKLSLMKRLVNQGFPFHRLVQQYRMDSTLFAFPNMFTYEGLLKTAASANLPINQDVGLALTQILGYKPQDKERRDLHPLTSERRTFAPRRSLTQGRIWRTLSGS